MSLDWNISESKTLDKSAATPTVSAAPLVRKKNLPLSVEAGELAANGESVRVTHDVKVECESRFQNNSSILNNNNKNNNNNNNTLSEASTVDASSTMSNMSGIKTEMQSLNSSSNNNTVSAAADSSDNQPPTPTDHHHQQQHHQPHQHHHPHQQQAQQLQQQQHPNALYNPALTNINQLYQDFQSYSYFNYEPFYNPPPPAPMDYTNSISSSPMTPMTSFHLQNQSMMSNQRYPSYMNNGGLHQLPPDTMSVNHVNNSGVNSVHNTSSSVSNSSLSPRVVSSSSPSQNNSAANTPHHNMGDVNSLTNRTTPHTPATTKQCNKCGMMCASETDLNDHHAAMHAAPPADECINSAERSASVMSERQYHSYGTYIKDEPPSADILDLDSQKMVYQQQPESDIANAGLHPMQRSMNWTQEIHSNYMPVSHLTGENKHPDFYAKQIFNASQKNNFQPIKTEYATQPNFHNPNNGQSIAPPPRSEDKTFGTNDLTAGNSQASSSPSEFPSTTTPQDNIQFRNFEPPTSSHPSTGVSTKASTWKSNEARRPKTYNCTACNKWFTSSGHLKRHYNTTLHKNAVKSSGQPDPATMPISAHHHPSRDPNSKHHRNAQSRQPPPIPPEPPRTPDYAAQYATPSPNGFPSQNQQPATYQYQPQGHLNSSVNGHPNGLAGPSVQVSQPRGLLNNLTTEVSTMEREQDQLLNTNHNQFHQQPPIQPVEPSQQQEQQQLQEVEMEDCSRTNNQLTATINLQQMQQQSPPQQQQPLQQPSIPTISHPQYLELTPIPPHQQEFRDLITFNTPFTIPSIMGQQQCITNPLPISTTIPTTTDNNTTIIPSFHHLQKQAQAHPPTCHITIGNATSTTLNQYVDLTNVFANDTALEQFQSNFVALHDGQIVQVFQPFDDSSMKENIVPDSPPNSDSEKMYQSVPTTYAIQSTVTQKSQSIAVRAKNDQGNAKPVTLPPSPAMSPTASSGQSVSPGESMSSEISSTSTPCSSPQNQHIAINQLQPIDDNIQSNKLPTVTPKRKPSRRKIPAVEDDPNVERLASGRILCKECQKDFTKMCYYTQHCSTFHSGEMPFKCKKCGKRYKLQKSYDIHVERHNAKTKKHPCDSCDKQFHHKADWRRHYNTDHSDIKLNVCKDCGKGFSRHDHLRKHEETHNRPPPMRKPRKNTKQTKKTVKDDESEASTTTSTASIHPQSNHAEQIQPVIILADQYQPQSVPIEQIQTQTILVNGYQSQYIPADDYNSHDISFGDLLVCRATGDAPHIDEIKVETYAMSGEELVYS